MLIKAVVRYEIAYGSRGGSSLRYACSLQVASSSFLWDGSYGHKRADEVAHEVAVTQTLEVVAYPCWFGAREEVFEIHVDYRPCPRTVVLRRGGAGVRITDGAGVDVVFSGILD